MVDNLMSARERVEQEANDLLDKINKLNDFRNSDKWEQLNETEQMLLNAQYDAMFTYEHILRIRLHVWRNEVWPIVD